MSVDRENRDRLAEAITRYLNEELTAFEFDEQIFNIAADSDDPTVDLVVHSLWYHYDDVTDHKVVLSKEEWNYVQRLVLLLRSDAHSESKTRRAWSLRQPLAVMALAVFGTCVLWLGWDWHLIWITVPLGGVSILLAHWRRRWAPSPSKRWASLTPFVSVSQMLAIRRRVTGFSKRRYPPHLKGRRLRTPAMERIQSLSAYALWLVFSPLALLWQTFPETEAEGRVVPA